MTHRDTGVAIKISLLIQCSSRIESQALNARQGTSVAIKQAIYISIPYDRAIQPGYISTQGFSASMPLNDTSLAIKEAICRSQTRSTIYCSECLTRTQAWLSLQVVSNKAKPQGTIFACIFQQKPNYF